MQLGASSSCTHRHLVSETHRGAERRAPASPASERAVEQRGAACTRSHANEPSKSFLASAQPHLLLRLCSQIRAPLLPPVQGAAAHATPFSPAQHPSWLHRKAGLAPAEAEMHKKASLCEPARQSGCVLMLPVAAKRRVGCQKRHSLESARPLIPSCSISVELRAARAPMNLADQLKGNACGLSSAALHPWRSSGGFGHHIDSFGRSAPNFAAAFRSATKLSARFPSPAAGVR